MIENFTTREQVVEAINHLFYYTDYQLWEQLMEEVFAEEVLMDISSSTSKEAIKMSAQDICDTWKEGFKDLDAIHHQPGNYIVNVSQSKASVKAYAIATHYKKSAQPGNTRKFAGSYDFELEKTEYSWRFTTFKFNLKYMQGSLNLE